MPQIKLLSEKTINQIAAGEVIERPMSVVKELVENSLDAGSTKLIIELENGGKNLISVSDNGCGIEKTQLTLAIERHATSKLDENDINNIKFLGFRGEALPSIAAVSKMRITSRTQDSNSAWQMTIEGGIKENITPAARDYGTTIEVRDLFCFTPARIKFLKSDVSEKIAVVELVNKFSLANPHVAIKLIYNDKILIDTKSTDFLRNKATEILGDDFIKQSLEFEANSQGIKLYGFAGVPTLNHNISNNLYTFVNSRSIKDKLVITAIHVAYTNLIPHGRYPAVLLFLEIDPYEIDVNVHPTKSEVRFKDPNFIKKFIADTIRTALRKTLVNKDVAEQKIDTGVYNAYTDNNNMPGAQHYKPKISSYSSEHEQHKTKLTEFSDVNSDYIAYGNCNPVVEIPKPLSSPKEIHEHHIIQKFLNKEPYKNEDRQAELISEKEYPLGTAKFQISNTYIVAENKEGFIVIDQHAAHERIVLEKIKQQLSEGKIKTQFLLIPHIIDLTVSLVEKLMEFQNEVKNLGFTIEKNGKTQVALREIPEAFLNISSQELIKDLAEMLFNYNTKEILLSKKEEILGNFACKTSIKAGRKLNLEEMNSLLRAIETTAFSGQCNHGRPTYIKFSVNDLEKLFERT
jgi:DNA mismatch repair protein MutL